MAQKQTEENNTFLGHLFILRAHIMRMVLYIAVGAVLAFMCDEIVYDGIIFAPRSEDFVTYRFFCFLSEKINQMGVNVDMCWHPSFFNIQNRELTGQFNSHLWVSFVSGLIIATPLIAWEIWRFVSPALTSAERRSSRGVVGYVSALFFVGVAFGYFIIVPMSLNFFAGYHVGGADVVVNNIELSSYISNVVNISLAAGIMFQMPIAIFVLSKMGLVSSAFLKKYRRHALVAILVVSAILTPPDIASQIILAVPTFALYQASIIICQRIERKRVEQQSEE
ncbi:MAG: twin-arginine translocase subunit TatC [Flavobacteriales bacterium]|nr:twin-arginine translocase subunit TatC [Flavobacteriales bacterium]